MDKRYLVFDIETITDWSLVRQVFNLDANATLEDMREQIKAKYNSNFAPPPFHIPVCIALIDIDFESYKVANAAVLENSDERSLLQHFWKVAKYRRGNMDVQTVLVHFNGRCFDLPVLFYRSLKHRVPILRWDRNRYSFESSHDVCDDLAEFGATGRPSLNVIGKMLGLPGKTDMDGSQVEELYFRGERTRIKDYCMDDALMTYYVWLTIKLVRGHITEQQFNEAYESAAANVKNSRLLTDSFFSPDVASSS